MNYLKHLYAWIVNFPNPFSDYHAWISVLDEDEKEEWCLLCGTQEDDD